MEDLKLGVHTSISGGLTKAIERASHLGCSTLQIFSRNPRGWLAKPLAKEELENFRRAHADSNLAPLVIHACYLINLAANDQETRHKSVEAFRDEVERAVQIGADFLVVHPGATKGASFEEGLDKCCNSIKESIRGLNLKKLTILIENTAGQGSSIGCSFNQIKEIVAACNSLPVSVCLDTCHSYASGYNIATDEGFHQAMKEIEDSFGFDQIKVVHCNDSKVALGSRVDRHWHIGEGEIGVKGFELLLKEPRLRKIPLILETPIDKLHDDAWNINRIKDIASYSSIK
ncbi:MAG: deoxyribonuclease IV [Blastocatellia bacterium]|nr:deoxyribonuclease IV [Blastocatellia bacterium]